MGLDVLELPWVDAASGHATVRFRTALGCEFTCFSDGITWKVGQLYGEVRLGALEIVTDYAEALDAGSIGDRSIEYTSEWDCLAAGQIVGLEGDTALLDCGGVVVELGRFATDSSVVGSWLKCRLERLEVISAGE